MSTSIHIADLLGAIPEASLHREEVADSKVSEVCERQWIAAAKKGDEPSFRALMELHEDRVFQLCRRLLDCPDEAMEACQDVFVKVYHALPKYQPSAKFSTWLYRIAVNRCKDGWKSAGRKFSQRCVSFLSSHEESQSVSLGQLEQRDDIRLLEEGLQTLPSKYRAVLILVSVEGMSHEEAADCLGCSIRAVEGRLYRARKALEAWWGARY